MAMDGGEMDDGRVYRRVLGTFATGVCVVTTKVGDQVAAITINSFTSVSLTPRLVLWCLDDRSDRYRYFAEAEQFAISVLGADQEPVSSRFARSGAFWADATGIADLAGVPVIAGGLAALACRAVERRTLGDHLVIVGEVFTHQARLGDGLTYFRGRYGQAQSPSDF
jgi:3-hydroxy-9,10-secoandrosta-1,3,5(10)-triene-9,17-dione monooxygenase reductase component